MESLYLLVPLSAFLVLALLGLFGWALNAGQFDDLEREGQRILRAADPALDADQAPSPPLSEE
jgi:cbb3-type cytochrome oxidase maturation protein